MKKPIYFILAIFFGFISCEGPVGPPGPPGLDGLDGLDGLAEYPITIDYEDVDFFPPDYDFTITLPFELFDDEVVLVYILWDVTGDGDPVWRQLPQTILFGSDIFKYNFDFTYFDVRLFMESNFDLETLTVDDLENQVFRIVVIPSVFDSGKHTIDFSNHDEAMEALNLRDLPTYSDRKFNRRGTLQ